MIRVTHIDEDQFEVAVRGHMLRVDQPVDEGGDDCAPTPTELFVSSLAACVAFYARRYLTRHDLPVAGLGVEAEFEFASRPTRVGDIRLRLLIPPGLPDQKIDGLIAVASHCTVHNSLTHPPAVAIEIDRRRSEAA